MKVKFDLDRWRDEGGNIDSEKIVYSYEIFGTPVISDVELNLKEPLLKRKFVEVKVQIDKEGVVTTSFEVKNGKIKAFPPLTFEYCLQRKYTSWKDIFLSEGKKVPICYETDLKTRNSPVLPVYAD